MTKTLLIDLDGVLNTYSGNYKDEKIPEPRKNVDTFLKKLSDSDPSGSSYSASGFK